MQPLNVQQLSYQGSEKSPQSVLLVHGLFGSGDNFKALGKELSENFQVYLVDALNHGQSPRAKSMQYHQQADALIATLDAFNIESCYLLGHSMGGKLAMATALLYPQRVDKLIVADMAPIAYQHGHNAEFKGLQSVNLEQIQNRRDADEVLAKYISDSSIRQFLLKSLKKDHNQWHWLFDVDNLEQTYPQMIDWPFTGQSYQKPTLFIKGQNSDYIKESDQQTITTQFPNARFKVIMQAGHWLHAQKPSIFNRLVKDFFSSEN
ncbi:alpha/beta fold hydrolase [Celerinatantimonas diazotrophica]|uniref:Esterase n=1 Tax=Celerinatantimonas diazotrophica TaxID=412034 RepID=A0A4V2PPR2_9GAMM|nr:alpha/beta fold hydrolase [Celerinatantimonas diazotrophica]TCK51811.1 esterase [Celerinatantimonas diazotrophica]CAG9296497.1 Esterase YbfF [Celerinatantimonas diazotrophica]